MACTKITTHDVHDDISNVVVTENATEGKASTPDLRFKGEGKASTLNPQSRGSFQDILDDLRLEQSELH